MERRGFIYILCTYAYYIVCICPTTLLTNTYLANSQADIPRYLRLCYAFTKSMTEVVGM